MTASLRYPVSDDDDEDHDDEPDAAMPAGPADDSMSREDVEVVKAAVQKMKVRLPALLDCDVEQPAFTTMRDDPERAPCVGGVGAGCVSGWMPWSGRAVRWWVRCCRSTKALAGSVTSCFLMFDVCVRACCCCSTLAGIFRSCSRSAIA